MQPLKRALQQTENRIEQIRSSLDAVEQQLVDPQLYDSQNKTKLTDLLLKQNQLKIDLDTQEKNWLDIQEQLDNFVLIT